LLRRDGSKDVLQAGPDVHQVARRAARGQVSKVGVNEPAQRRVVADSQLLELNVARAQ
jgi:hypothetical protein